MSNKREVWAFPARVGGGGRGELDPRRAPLAPACCERDAIKTFTRMADDTKPSAFEIERPAAAPTSYSAYPTPPAKPWSFGTLLGGAGEILGSVASSSTTPLRHLVSGSKLRTVDGGFDLDLTYVTPRIIALGLPATGIEKLYRNPISEVRRFMTRHADHYAMVNLCDERDYADEDWPQAACVMRFPFQDHHACCIGALQAWCERATHFLDADEKNVLAVCAMRAAHRTHA